MITSIVTVYDSAGKLLQATLPISAGKIHYQYDQAHRLKSIKHNHWSQSNTYDAVGNLTAYKLNDLKGEFSTEFSYDDLYQLKRENESTYEHDSVNNRLKKNETDYKVNDLNQIMEREGHYYQYDLNGNLIQDVTTEKTTYYKYDELDRLIEVQNDGQRYCYEYDALNRRIRKEVHGEVTDYLYQMNHEIGSYTNGELKELRILGKGKGAEIGATVAIEQEGELYVPIHNMNGSIVALIIARTGECLESHPYDAFGETDNQSRIPWGFLSKRKDSETGLIYFGLRYYVPSLGRWINPDPDGFNDGPNLYAFTKNNPFKFIDLFGLNAVDLHDPYNSSESLYSSNYRFQSQSDFKSAFGGISHGVVDFFVASFHDLQISAMYIGSSELEMSHEGRLAMYKEVELSQKSQMASVEKFMMNILEVNESNALYQFFRSKTTMGLEVGSIVTGAYGAVKGLVNLNRLAKVPKESAKIVKLLNDRKGISLAGSRRVPLHYPKFQDIRNETTVINGRTYSGHALDRMQDRGFMPSVIENALETGLARPNRTPGRMEYIDQINNLRVIVENNEIVTVIPTGSS